MSQKWKEKDGIPLDEPVKFNDDGVDGLRYGAYSSRKGSGKWYTANENNYGSGSSSSGWTDSHRDMLNKLI